VLAKRCRISGQTGKEGNNVLRITGNILGMIVIGIVIVVVSFSAGFGAHQARMYESPDELPAEQTRDEEFSLFWEAWDLLEADYYGELPDLTEASRAAVKGVTRSLGDPNTFLLEPDLAKVVSEDMTGQFEGIGASVRTDENGFFTIVQPFEDSPAYRAGLQPGDIVLEVDGAVTQGLSTTEVISMIRGPKGTVVTLLIFRPDTQEQFTAEVERDRIDIPTIETRWLEDDSVAYIRLREFNAVASEQLHAELRAMLAQDPAGLILDLRGNPGGLLDAAISVASEFVGEGIITEERFRDGTTTTYEALPGGVATSPTLPLIVLVNGASASASEIVAGAVQDSERGILLGTLTYGKGSVQIPHRLSDGSQLRVTTAHWFTPKGRDIHQQGLEPDVEEPFSWDEYTAGNDTQLKRALELILEMANKKVVSVTIKVVMHWSA